MKASKKNSIRTKRINIATNSEDSKNNLNVFILSLNYLSKYVTFFYVAKLNLSKEVYKGFFV